MNDQKYSQPSPWEPYRLFSFFMFITWFGAGILLGLNWKRLGKPEWVLKTVLLSILIPAVTITGMLIFLFSTSNMNLPELFVMVIISLTLSINFAYLWALARLQSGAYKKFKAAGFSALQGYEYDVDSAMFFGGIVAIIMSVIIAVVIPLLG